MCLVLNTKTIQRMSHSQCHKEKGRRALRAELAFRVLRVLAQGLWLKVNHAVTASDSGFTLSHKEAMQGPSLSKNVNGKT